MQFEKFRSNRCRTLVHRAHNYSLVYLHVRLFNFFFFFRRLATFNFISMYSIHKRYENPYLSTFLGEIIGLSVLWLFWIVGAAIASVSVGIPLQPLAFSKTLDRNTLTPPPLRQYGVA